MAPQPDPFSAVHSDIHDLIIQHFKVEDIKQLTTVSKGWNQIIGGSSAAMRRILLIVSDSSERQPRSEVTPLLLSDRKYQNMSIFLNYAKNKKRKVMLSKASSLLVELHLHKEKDLLSDLSFPKLKAIRAISISVGVAMKFIKGASKLERLVIRFCTPWEFNKEFVEILLEKKTLKELALSNVPENFFSSDSFRTPEFKLTSLNIEFYRSSYFSDPNFNAFVLAMAETLTSLNIYCFRDEYALLNQNLPALKTLKIGCQQECLLSTYKPNTSIEAIEIGSINSTPPAFLKSLMSVRSMFVNWIDKDDLKKILECCPGLTKLEIGSAWQTEKKIFEEIYKIVRSVEPSSVESIEVKIERKKPFVLEK
jgi:hypothetical protein